MNRQSMEHVHYGFQKPLDLLDKLLEDATAISGIPNRNSLFNFIVTAAVLNEWVRSFYKSVLSTELLEFLKCKSEEGLPEKNSNWLDSKESIPNPNLNESKHIHSAMSICWGTANASKHFYWHKNSGIGAIGSNPVIRTWYQYYYTSVKEGLYINFKDENYSAEQVKDILVQFYPKLIEHLELLLKNQKKVHDHSSKQHTTPRTNDD